MAGVSPQREPVGSRTLSEDLLRKRRARGVGSGQTTKNDRLSYRVLARPTRLRARKSTVQRPTIIISSPAAGGPAIHPVARSTIHTSDTIPLARITAVA